MLGKLLKYDLKWIRFVKNLYKDESYLTHTLPVNKEKIYVSKILSALITVFTTAVVIIVCLFICYYSKENLEILKSMLELAASTYDTTVISLLLLIAFVFFLEVMFMILINTTDIVNIDAIKIVMLTGVAIYIIYIGIYYFKKIYIILTKMSAFLLTKMVRYVKIYFSYSLEKQQNVAKYNKGDLFYEVKKINSCFFTYNTFCNSN